MRFSESQLRQIIRTILKEEKPAKDLAKMPQHVKNAFSALQELIKIASGASSIREVLNRLPVGTTVWQWSGDDEIPDPKNPPQLLIVVMEKVDQRKTQYPSTWVGDAFESRRIFADTIRAWVKPETAEEYRQKIMNLKPGEEVMIAKSDAASRGLSPGPMLIAAIGPGVPVPDWARRDLKQSPAETVRITFTDPDIDGILDAAKGVNVTGFRFGIKLPNMPGIVPLQEIMMVP